MMHPVRLFLATAFLCTLFSRFATASPADEEAQALIERILPARADRFKVDTSLPQVDGHDTFSLADAPDGRILLRGNNGVSVASAFNWYLKNRAQCHLSWCGDQLNLPAELPKVGEPVTVTCPLQRRVYFNYCTLSYSAAWWDWKRWQREIDFMAMQGINTPLSMVGLEAVWYNTLLKHGLTDAEAREFLVGPGYFAWQWMTNIENHAGPLPKSWIEQSSILGKQILQRQRALGMTPIQQGFTGHVPRLLKDKFPNANISFKHEWCGFPGAAQLDPLDPLFDQIGKTFLEEQEKLFGTSHLYGCDPFHEGSPPVDGDAYLTKVREKIDHLITSHDPKGIVVMQSWSIRRPLATAIPKDHLLVVDLGGAKHAGTSNFWGYPFVTGRLHNFGNRINLHGDLRKLATNPFAGMSRTIPNCVGGGLFMEGIIQNPAYYELAFDTLWKSEPVDPNQWLHDYARRRYGASSEAAAKAWDILLETAYKPGTDGVENSSMVAARPAIQPKKSGPNSGFNIPYPPRELFQAWSLLLTDADKLGASDAYRFDLVDIGRQVLSNHAQLLQPRIRAAWEKRDLAAFDRACAEFDQLLLDIDTLLRPRPEFSLGKWISDARSHGTTAEEKNLYELNARTIVSVWGPVKGGGPVIMDYSWREWSGLIKDFYLVRWQKHHAMLRKHLVEGTPYTEEGIPQVHGREAFRANPFFSQLGDWELAWATRPGPVDPPPSGGGEIELARRFRDHYAAAINAGVQVPEELTAQLGKPVGEWSPATVSTRDQVLKMPITTAIDGEGTYTLSFRYTEGRSRLNIAKVELLENDQVLDTDTHPGFAGEKHTDNTYTLKLAQHAFGAAYSVRITARAEGSNQSHGRIFLKKNP